MTWDSDLMYTCSLIEYIGRDRKLRRGDVVGALGEACVRRIYRHACVLHSDSIERVACEYVQIAGIPEGTFDNVGACRYEVPDYWAIGQVYERLIEDVFPDDPVGGIMQVYGSWIDDAISNYNSDFFYQPRDYLRECWRAGEVLE